MHFCHEELYAIMALIAAWPLIWLMWLKKRWHAMRGFFGHPPKHKIKTPPDKATGN